MENILALLLVAVVCSVVSLPLESSYLSNRRSDVLPALAALDGEDRTAQAHKIQRRFINPLFSLGIPDSDNMTKIRTKRSYDECEKLQLCKLHARSQRNFLAAYELYFVNRENARLWDHRARSTAECERRYGDCYKK